MKPELKPCPFCGSTNIELDQTDISVVCGDCAAEGPFGDADMGFAIEAWNTRAEPVSVPSDDAILDIAVAQSLAYHDGTGIVSPWREDADIREYVLAFARALLAKYGHNNICCNNPSQCWEPCGDLGNSAEHAAVAPKGVNSIPPLDDESDILTTVYMSGLEDGKKCNRTDATRYRLLRSMPQGLKILTQVAPGEWEEILSGDDLDTFLKEYPR